jgi:hypothetical protein
MSDSSYSLRDLQLLTRNNPAHSLFVRQTFCESYDEFVSIVNDAIDLIAAEFAQTRHKRQDRSEDELTVDLVSSLVFMGFEASHDTDVGGHCDVVIKHRGIHLWLGESKKHSSYDWLLQGFQQLDMRYATGLPNHNQNGILIYCYQKNVKRIMENWMAHLVASRPDVQAAFCEKNPLVFISRHTHEGSGLELIVRHVPVLLYHDPNDKNL